jgi:hypothetical protein
MEVFQVLFEAFEELKGLTKPENHFILVLRILVITRNTRSKGFNKLGIGSFLEV